MSKLSIGVYGDSFANMNLDKPGSYSWIDQLSTHHDVTNYGQCGNSVFQCYKDYRENKFKHDRNIFVIPTLQRFYSQQLYHLLDGIHPFNNWYVNIGSLEVAEISVSQSSDPDAAYKLKIMQNVKFAMVEWIDSEYLTETSSAIVDKIRNDEKLILIDTNHVQGKVCLTDVSIRELEWVGYKEQYLDKGLHLNSMDRETKTISSDCRSNHFSKENNIVLGNILLDAIDNNYRGELELSYEQFVKPAGPLDQYLKWMRYE